MFSIQISTTSPKPSSWAIEKLNALITSGIQKEILMFCDSRAAIKEIQAPSKQIKLQTIREFFEKQCSFLQKASSSRFSNFGSFYGIYLEENLLSTINFEETCKISPDKSNDNYDFVRADVLYKELCLLAPHGIYENNITTEESFFKIDEFPEIKERIQNILGDYRTWMNETGFVNTAVSQLFNPGSPCGEKKYDAIIFNVTQELTTNMKAFLFTISHKIITSEREMLAPKTKSQIKNEKRKTKTLLLTEIKTATNVLINRIYSDKSDDAIILNENEKQLLKEISVIRTMLTSSEGCHVLSEILAANPQLAITTLENLSAEISRKEPLSEELFLKFVRFLTATDYPMLSVHFFIAQESTEIFEKILDIFITLKANNSGISEKIRVSIMQLMCEQKDNKDALPYILCLPKNHHLLLTLINEKIFPNLGGIWNLIKNNPFLSSNLSQTNEGISILSQFSKADKFGGISIFLTKKIMEQIFLKSNRNTRKDVDLISLWLNALIKITESSTFRSPEETGSPTYKSFLNFLKDSDRILEDLAEIQENFQKKSFFKEPRKIIFSLAIILAEKYIEAKYERHALYQKIILILKNSHINNKEDFSRASDLFRKIHAILLTNTSFIALKADGEKNNTLRLINIMCNSYFNFIKICYNAIQTHKIPHALKSAIEIYSCLEENRQRYICKNAIIAQDDYAAAYAGVWLIFEKTIMLDKSNELPFYTNTLSHATNFITTHPINSSWSEEKQCQIGTYIFLFFINFIKSLSEDNWKNITTTFHWEKLLSLLENCSLHFTGTIQLAELFIKNSQLILLHVIKSPTEERLMRACNIMLRITQLIKKYFSSLNIESLNNFTHNFGESICAAADKFSLETKVQLEERLIDIRDLTKTMHSRQEMPTSYEDYKAAFFSDAPPPMDQKKISAIMAFV